jgi:hypothetical protein
MLLFALVYLARHVPSAREDPKEEQRPVEDGSQVRPDINARLLLQLDDLH